MILKYLKVQSVLLSIRAVYVYIPYIIQSIKHGIQYIGHKVLQVYGFNRQGNTFYEIRSIQAQKDGEDHDLYSYQKSHI